MVVYNSGPMAIHITVIERPGSGCLPDGTMNTLVHVYINSYLLNRTVNDRHVKYLNMCV